MVTAALEHDLITTLKRTAVEQVPWTYSYVPEALPGDLASSLWSSFGRFELTPCEEREREKSYRFATTELDTDAPSELPDEAWRGVVEAVSSPSYREAIGELMGVSLADAQTTLSLWEYRTGNWLAPHLDKPEKLVTQIFYLTAEWREDDGGRLLVLRDESPTSVARALPPVLGSSAILLRSEKSWHAVEAPREGAAPRRSMTVTFWKGA